MYRDSFDHTRYNPFQVVKTKTVFNMPLKLKLERSEVWHGRPLIFTSSLTDVFHQDIDQFRHEMWYIIRKCPQFIFQILTKRPERISEHLPEFWDEIKDRCWLGTSVGSQNGIQRMIDLSMVECGIKFLSLEPLHGEISLSSATIYVEQLKESFHVLPAFDWVIVGGESGNEHGKYKYRHCELAWIEKIVNDCTKNSIPVFVKQMGTYLAKELKMSDRHGGDINEFPEHLKIRQFPPLKI